MLLTQKRCGVTQAVVSFWVPAKQRRFANRPCARPT